MRTEMDADAAEKAKARRVQRWLYAIMAGLILTPLVVAYFLK